MIVVALFGREHVGQQVGQEYVAEYCGNALFTVHKVVDGVVAEFGNCLLGHYFVAVFVCLGKQIDDVGNGADFDLFQSLVYAVATVEVLQHRYVIYA